MTDYWFPLWFIVVLICVGIAMLVHYAQRDHAENRIALIEAETMRHEITDGRRAEHEQILAELRKLESKCQ